MREQYDIKKLKVKRRGILPGLQGEEPVSKVRITISLDKEVVDYFKEEAEHPGSLPYQTQINQALREMICKWHMSTHDDIKHDLLNDIKFIKQMADKIEKHKHNHY